MTGSPSGSSAGPVMYWWFLQVVWLSHSMAASSEGAGPKTRHSQGPGRTCKASYDLVVEVQECHLHCVPLVKSRLNGKELHSTS